MKKILNLAAFFYWPERSFISPAKKNVHVKIVLVVISRAQGYNIHSQ